jgi:hypothetical protein
LTERSLYPELIKGALLDGWALFRIGDGSYGKKPFDIAGASKHPECLAVGIEVKLIGEIPELGAFPWDHLFSDRTHQLNWLSTYASLGCVAGIAIYEAKKSTMKILYPHAKQFGRAKSHEMPKIQLFKCEDCWRGWRLPDRCLKK